MDIRLCSVCDVSPPKAGALVCAHHFCPECFARYVAGSVDELHTHMRCCICGATSPLVVEISEEQSDLRFGRSEHQPKLLSPSAIAFNEDIGYVIVDRNSERVYVFSDQGKVVHHFAYIHNTEPTGGLAVTPGGQIAISFKTQEYDLISFFSAGGHFLGSSYIPGGPAGERAEVQGMTCCPKNQVLYVADTRGRAIHVIDINTKLQTTKIPLDPIQFETPPEPRGLVVTSGGDILLADAANHCIKRYNSSGHFLQKVGSRGQRPVQFEQPTGVAVTSSGDILVADRGNQRVQLLDSRGHFRRYVVRFRQGDDVYMAPSDVMLVKKDRIAVMLTATQQADVAEVRLYQ